MPNRQIFGLVLLGVMIGLGFIVVRPFLTPLVWAAILAYVTGPYYLRVLRFSGNRSSLAAAIATLVLMVVLVVPVSFLLIRLQSELAEAYRDMSTKFADQPLVLPKAVTGIPVLGPILDEAVTQVWNDPELRKEQVKEWLEPWVRELAGIIGRIGRTAVQLAVTTITLFFFYRDGELVLEQARRGLRKVAGEPADRYLKAVGETAQAVVFGLIVSALAQGLIAGIGYAFIGVGTPILLGALTAVTALVPFLGTVAVWGPIGLWLLLSDQIGIGLALLAWGAFIVNPTDNILKPLLISNATDVPLVIVLFGVMGGLLAFGLVGLFLGPLILAVLFAVWREWLAADGPRPDGRI
ncbi:AI-2E family transporter [Methylocystis echinoides]|uniref:AI-2E family transporter n=1 Tax=Methylocystis echinoides TaxID=29468 RepID=A0A9W6GYE1_9HYPH|nr:AI-2E family transporter [Methylocystis echinoides]GLI95368.1 AI-2E family transporter [Methylocystis echinoides]